MRRSILILIFLVSALPAGAKDFYIAAKQAGTGSGTGCSTAKPYTWFNTANSWGTGSTQIGPGTTVHLCGTFTGTAGQQLLLVGGSGTSSSPITIKFETNAVLTAPYWSSQGGMAEVGRSYIVIDGGTNGLIKNTANGTGRGYAQDSRAIYAPSCTGCVIKNLTIADLYVRTSISDLAVRQTSVNCVYWLNSNNITITHVTCHDAGWAFTGYGNNFTLSYCNIYNIDHGLAFGPQGTNSGFSIHDNHIHDYVKWDSTTNVYHHDGLHIWGQNGGIATNGVIYNNIFDGDSGVNITAHIYLQDSINTIEQSIRFGLAVSLVREYCQAALQPEIPPTTISYVLADTCVAPPYSQWLKATLRQSITCSWVATPIFRCRAAAICPPRELITISRSSSRLQRLTRAAWASCCPVPSQ